MEQYEVIQEIGRGTFGTVTLMPAKTEDEWGRYEMELHSRIEHPFIVEYKGSWEEEDGTACLLLDYCEGGDMYKAIKKANGVFFLEEKLCKWFVQLLMALDYLHRNCILHQDISPKNFFLTKDDDIRLGDFGFAEELDSPDDLSDKVCGCVGFMCPEMVSWVPHGPASDIWALGCSMYQMASFETAFSLGDPLFENTLEGQEELNRRIKEVPVSPLPTEYSGAFRSLVDRMLEKDPALRPTAGELLKDPHLEPYVLEVKAKINGFLGDNKTLVVGNATAGEDEDGRFCSNSSPSHENAATAGASSCREIEDALRLLELSAEGGGGPEESNEGQQCRRNK
ncbi:unnamed protein product [Linum trigynum]|uniref:Protein kinase domain-containing protein n=1 Tax=Linum trigynum TaxID=586398 RepID=A0AAV2FJW5_9ROSI